MQTGSLVSQLSQNPQKFDGLAGITLGAIIQALSTAISGSILGLIFHLESWACWNRYILYSFYIIRIPLLILKKKTT